MKKFIFFCFFTFCLIPAVEAQTLTQNSSLIIADDAGIGCTSGSALTDNFFYRSFPLPDYGISGQWVVTGVEFGIDTLWGPDGVLPVTVALYTSDNTFPNGNLTELTHVTRFLANTGKTLYTFPVIAFVPAEAELVVEVSVTANENGVFLAGCNFESETVPWYWKAPSCGINSPVSNQAISLSNSWVLKVTGVGPGDIISNPSACGLNLDIGDNNCPEGTTFEIAVSDYPVNMLGDNFELSDVNLIIEHPRVSDLNIRLTSPKGITVDLSLGNGGSGENMGNPEDETCTQVLNLNMNADISLSESTAPFIGSFIPDGNFADFNDGSNPVGIWTLNICDSETGEDGNLKFAELVFSQKCPEPTNLTTSDITYNSATLSWDPNGASQWEVELIFAGTEPTGSGVLTNSPGYNATDLLGSVDYSWYVRAICDEFQSDWIGPVNFTTAVPPLSNPSLCGMNLFIDDNSCPEGIDYYIDVNNEPGNSLGVDIYLSDVNLIIQHTRISELEISLISPSGVEVLLYPGSMEEGENMGNPGNDECIQVTNFSINASTPILEGEAPFIGSFLPSGDFSEFNDESSPNGLWKIHFCDGVSGDLGFLKYIELVFEPMIVSCSSPVDLAADSITDATANLSWTETGNADQWEIEILLADEDPAGSGMITDDNPYTVSGLESQTAYKFYVRAICEDNEQSTWSGPAFFNTIINSIKNREKTNPVGVYPVPAHDRLTVEIAIPVVRGAILTLKDLGGKEVFMVHPPINPAGYRETLNLSSLKSGIYFLTFYNGNAIYRKKILLQ